MGSGQAEKGLGKLADFDEFYDSGDPREYFRGFGPLEYEVPHHGQQVFRQVLESMPVRRPLVVDVCCSYGVNAALMKHDLELSDLYAHYGSEYVDGLSITELADLDRQFFANSRIDDAPTVVGVDSAGRAVDYALDVGLLDVGADENLEVADPSPELAAVLGDVDLITVTGGIGYVTATTFDRLLSCTNGDKSPWVAALCLRTVPFEPIADCLGRHGLVTEQLADVTFPQRLFADSTERDFALEQLAAQGLDADGRESDGRYHVNVYVARPAAAAAEVTMAELLGGLADDNSTLVPD